MNENNIKVLFPEGVETITISKNDYDRLYGQLTYENIILQSKIDKAIEFIKESNIYYEITHYIPEDEKQFKINMETLTNHLLDILKEDK